MKKNSKQFHFKLKFRYINKKTNKKITLFKNKGMK